MACRPQGNPRSASSDGVPLELAVLGFRGVSAPTGLTGLREASLVKINCDLCVLTHLCVDQICINRSAMSSLCTGLNRGAPPHGQPTKDVGRPCGWPNFGPLFSMLHNDCHILQKHLNARRVGRCRPRSGPKCTWT